MDRQASIFISHGAPTVALEKNAYTNSLRAMALKKNAPDAIVVMSAHGLSALGSLDISSADRHSLLYDFSGFSRDLYEIKYPCPGSPSLANEIQILFDKHSIQSQLSNERKLDHGVWVPLLHMYPDASIPIVQVSMPYPSTPQEIFNLGRSMRPLREKNVMLLASGGAVHNLRMLQWSEDEPQEDIDWAIDFNDWLKKALSERRFNDILEFETNAPSPRMSHPTSEHFLPICFSLGALFDDEKVKIVFDGFQMATLSLLSFMSERSF